ncbi:jupiter microtubule associated homolog 1 isoform X2 [Rhinatrema bivittatum]|uniref:jupiter microtubule associated homolog 1 isoform X2 n=1 Tax=Rhinatrema bivittatum TaxID=194408 RepID=UPI00112C6808|nr:jupiter microtubule associated homolog 1 isoform X2 [Rhinatrema bivittatum]
MKVLQPPGGGSSFSLGTGEKVQQPVRKNRMASNIFGPPEELPCTTSRTNLSGDKTTGMEDLNQSSPRRRMSSGNCGDTADKGEANSFENNEMDKESGLGPYEETDPVVVPAADPTPTLPAAVPSRRNPPGGKSSLVLG